MSEHGIGIDEIEQPLGIGQRRLARCLLDAHPMPQLRAGPCDGLGCHVAAVQIRLEWKIVDDQPPQAHAHLQDVLHPVRGKVIVEQFRLVGQRPTVAGSKERVPVGLVGALDLVDRLGRRHQRGVGLRCMQFQTIRGPVEVSQDTEPVVALLRPALVEAAANDIDPEQLAKPSTSRLLE